MYDRRPIAVQHVRAYLNSVSSVSPTYCQRTPKKALPNSVHQKCTIGHHHMANIYIYISYSFMDGPSIILRTHLKDKNINKYYYCIKVAFITVDRNIKLNILF